MRKRTSNRVKQGSFTKFLSRYFAQKVNHQKGKKMTSYPHYQGKKNEDVEKQ